MSSVSTKVKTIRLANEAVEFYEGKPLNRMVESLMCFLMSGEIKFDGENLVVEGIRKSEVYKDLEMIVGYYGITVDDLMGILDKGLNEGTITLDGDKLVVPG